MPSHVPQFFGLRFLLLATSLILLWPFEAQAQRTRATVGYQLQDAVFRNTELSLDLFGNIAIADNRLARPGRVRDGRLGVGAGVNYYMGRYFGLGADAYLGDIDSRFIDHLSFSLMARYPMEEIRLAPYAFGGIGRMWDPVTQYTGHLGAGVDYRFSRGLGLFSDARFVFADQSRDFGLARLGLRIVF
jgi:hypothetical protein